MANPVPVRRVIGLDLVVNLGGLFLDSFLTFIRHRPLPVDVETLAAFDPTNGTVLHEKRSGRKTCLAHVNNATFLEGVPGDRDQFSKPIVARSTLTSALRWQMGNTFSK